MRQNQRGVSLIEMLVVVAIIGMVSVIAVPAFVTNYRANKMRAAVREFTSDVRWARQRAVTRNLPTKISFTTGGDRIVYTIFDGNPAGTAWTALEPVVRSLNDGVFFNSTTFVDNDSPFDASTDSPSDGEPDIIFRPNGSLGSGAAQNVVLRFPDKNIAFNEYTVTIGVAGTVRTDRSKF